MSAESAQEQLMLELVNRARMNPSAEAARFGINLNQGLAPGTISATPKQVLAMNDLLVIASDRHSNWMLINDQFDHNEAAAFPSGRTGFSFTDRMTAAGYNPLTAGAENIAFIGQSGAIDATAAIIEQHKGLFLSEGHRVNMLADLYREVGIGQQIGLFTQNGFTYNASMVTQDFALSGTRFFITGVVYNDTVVNDDFFTVGEQTAGRNVSTTGATSVTGAGGGYELGYATPGAKTVTFSLAGGTIQLGVTLGSANLKVDIVNGKEVWTNASLKVIGGPVTELHALGILSMSLTGGAGNELLFGNTAANVLIGGGGNDFLNGQGGADNMVGQDGNDAYRVDNAGDVVNEINRTGIDTVQTTISFKLTDAKHARGDIENVILLGSAGISAFGNTLANGLVGNAAGNVINAGPGNDVLVGGAGMDTLTGGRDSDTFTFNAPLSNVSRDVITDFTNAAGNDDAIRLENAVMPALGARGALNPAFFRAGAAAVDADDHVIYNQSNGMLSYDSNGNVAGGVTLLATLTTHPILTAADFFVL
jgi:Ca2+-binding RTX toxin-like protein